VRELEAKLRIAGLTMQEACRKIEDSGLDVGGVESQHDVVFAASASAIVSAEPGSVVARIRQTDGASAVLTVKRRRDLELDREEAEFAVDDPTAATQCLRMLGLEPLLEIQKVRAHIRVSDSVSILVDDVVGLGLFVELEVLTDDSNADVMLEEAVVSMNEMFSGHASRETRGYDSLLLMGNHKS
jgi:predicted adenylyl cyclase CyaB